MTNLNFTRRTGCPSCLEADKIDVLLAKKYSDEFFRHYFEINRERRPGGHKLDPTAFENASYEVSHCRSCDLVFQSIIPTAQMLQKEYEEWNDMEMNLRYSLESGERFGKIRSFLTELLSIIEHFGKDPRDFRVLDFGMGWSEFSLIARALGVDVIGAELAPSKIAYAKEQGLPVANLDDLEPGSFDFVHTEQVFEHLDDPRHYLTRLSTLLKKDGILKISVPYGDQIREHLQTYNFNSEEGIAKLNPLHPIQHLNCFSSTALTNFGERNGLRKVNPKKLDIVQSWYVRPPKWLIRQMLKAFKKPRAPRELRLEQLPRKFFTQA